MSIVDARERDRAADHARAARRRRARARVPGLPRPVTSANEAPEPSSRCHTPANVVSHVAGRLQGGRSRSRRRRRGRATKSEPGRELRDAHPRDQLAGRGVEQLALVGVYATGEREADVEAVRCAAWIARGRGRRVIEISTSKKSARGPPNDLPVVDQIDAMAAAIARPRRCDRPWPHRSAPRRASRVARGIAARVSGALPHRAAVARRSRLERAARRDHHPSAVERIPDPALSRRARARYARSDGSTNFLRWAMH